MKPKKNEGDRILTLIIVFSALNGLAALLRLIGLIAEHVHVTVTP